ncbi:hypothetical protein [Streptomyces roseochromogenus]|uniref:Tail protein n=1 Tax=Streptomyces roseochromogenus subsp. oscitans DS 12.976 TaxID=1352936 RepID=V6JZ26_STRRC|nr:hypothetical protein [Streptomyces roseochromogenus]EST24386.1 hypothetical protein M878_30705 [Streptomyces roseochromogenus subsp. oscitans DS 12.976]
MTTPINQIPASSIPATRAYLLAQLQTLVTADPNDANASLLVCMDGPSTDIPEDIVSVGDVHQNYNPEANVGSGGSHWLYEDYTVTVDIQVTRNTDDSTVTFNRARTLADLVVALVRSDPSLGQVVDRARPSVVTHETDWVDTGRRTAITIGIACLKSL